MNNRFPAIILAVLLASIPLFAQTPDDPEGLWSQVAIYRDAWGVPHVYGETIRATAFGHGYAQAQDHLEGMLIAYRVANGRASEIYGEAFAVSDEFALALGNAEMARAAYEQSDPVTRDLCEGFALGANAYLLTHLDTAPEWAEGIHPADILALLHSYLMSQAPLDLPDTYRRPAGTPSANAWAIGPSMSATGDAMLVINPHTDYTDIFQWYEVHLVSPDFNISGATLYGLPIVLQGFNEDLGWALSPNDADFADAYVEPMPQFARNPKSVMNRQAAEPDETQLLEFVAQTRPYYVRTENGMEERAARRMFGERGPVIAQRDGRLVTWRIGGYGEFGALRQLYEMARSADNDEFQRALSMLQMPCFHVVYADRQGNIFYRYNANMGEKFDPLAEDTGSGTALVWNSPLSTIDSTYEWGAQLSVEALPTVLNPDAGFLQACGTPPWAVTDNSGTTRGDWPLWFAQDADSYRARRVRQLLSMGPRSFEDQQAMLFDTVVPFAVEAVPYLLALAEQQPDYVANAHPDLEAALDMLREWDRLADSSSAAMTFFHVWWTAFYSYSPVPFRTVDDLYGVIAENSPAIQEHALQSAAEAAKLMRNQFQSISVPWGEVHRIGRGNRDEPMPGSVSGGPLFLASDTRFSDGQWPVHSGYGFAMVVRFGPTPESVSVVPFGSSDDPDSPHFDDQLDLFLGKRFKSTPFLREDVERQAASAVGTIVTLRPEGSPAVVSIRADFPVEASLTTTREEIHPLPMGIAAFTPMMEPVVTPRDTPMEITLEVEIAEGLCARERLGELVVSGYHPDTGWYPLDDQSLDPERRIVTARLESPQIVVVLGPVDALRKGLDDRPAEFFARAVVPKPKNYKPILRENTGPVDPRLMEALPPFGEDKTEGDMPGATTEISPRKVQRNFNRGLATPADAPVFNPVPPTATPHASPEEETVPGPSPEPTPVASAESAAVEDAPAEAEPGPPGDLLAQAPPKERKGRVVMTTESLQSLLGNEHKAQRHTSLFLVQDPSKASPMEVGKAMQLRPPVDGALFHITTEKMIRAQVAIAENPPVALPDGLAAFTWIFTVEHDPVGVVGRTVLSLRVPPGVCASASFEALKLYAYDEGAGWRIVDGQKTAPESMGFSAMDDGLRTYAILGPAEHLLKSPVR